MVDAGDWRCPVIVKSFPFFGSHLMKEAVSRRIEATGYEAETGQFLIGRMNGCPRKTPA